MQNRAEVANTLGREGVVSIDGYWSEDKCEEVRSSIQDSLDNNEYEVAADDASYYDLVNTDNAVLNKRSGKRDTGMIDIFNLDLEMPIVSEFKLDEDIKWVVNEAAGSEFSVDNVNAYVNSSVSETRGFHADTYRGKYKAFLYLTDVPNESYGPFSYVKGTHRRSRIKIKVEEFLNRLEGKKKTDARKFDQDDVVKYTAKKGTLIIANQAGYHRGWPQENGYERMLLTNSYTPAED
jgi:hypothetical protein